MRVLVLGGGSSPEREVSLRSASAIARALVARGHEVFEHDPAEGACPPADALLDRLASVKPDVVFVALHGGAGEDGTLQSLLELAKVPYTGSTPHGSALAMDKVAARLSLGAGESGRRRGTGSIPPTRSAKPSSARARSAIRSS